MKILIHPHARLRMWERGATGREVEQTVLNGRVSSAKFGRTRFRRVPAFNRNWNGKYYARRQIDAFAVKMDGGWLVVTAIVKYF